MNKRQMKKRLEKQYAEYRAFKWNPIARLGYWMVQMPWPETFWFTRRGNLAGADSSQLGMSFDPIMGRQK